MRQLDHARLPVQKVIFVLGIEWGKSHPFKRTDCTFGKPYAEQRLSQSPSAETTKIAKVRLPAPAAERAVWTRSSYKWISYRRRNFVTPRKNTPPRPSWPTRFHRTAAAAARRGPRRVAPSARAPPAAAASPPHGATCWDGRCALRDTEPFLPEPQHVKLPEGCNRAS